MNSLRTSAPIDFTGQLETLTDSIEKLSTAASSWASYLMHAGPLVLRSNIVEPIAALDAQLGRHRSAPPRAGTSATVSIYVHYLDPADSADLSLWSELQSAACHLCSEIQHRGGEASMEGLWQIRSGGKDFLFKRDAVLVRVSCTNAACVTLIVLGTPSVSVGGCGPYRMKGGAEKAIHLFDWELVTDLVKALYAHAHGLFSVHAAMVSKARRAILIGGVSGSGKTTTALSLVRQGFSLHTDDYCLTRSVAIGGVLCGGILMPPRFVGAPPEDLNELETTLSRPKGSGKYPYSEAISSEAQTPLDWLRPQLVLLLASGDLRPDEHAFTRLDFAESVAGVMELVLDPMQAMRREEWLDTALELVNSCPVYRVSAGRDLHTLAQRIQELVFDV